MILTEKILNSGMSRNGSWNKKQLTLFGLVYNSHNTPEMGWKQEIIGHNFDDTIIQRFLALKDNHLKSDNQLNFF